MKNEILSILNENKEHWVKGSTMVKMFNLRGLYELRAYIKELREDGNIIIGGNNGYMLTYDIDKAQEYVNRRMVEIYNEQATLLTMMGKKSI